MASTVNQFAAWGRTGPTAPKTLLLSTPTLLADLFNPEDGFAVLREGIRKKMVD